MEVAIDFWVCCCKPRLCHWFRRRNLEEDSFRPAEFAGFCSYPWFKNQGIEKKTWDALAAWKAEIYPIYPMGESQPQVSKRKIVTSQQI